jgi:hypothetical protein
MFNSLRKAGYLFSSCPVPKPLIWEVRRKLRDAGNKLRGTLCRVHYYDYLSKTADFLVYACKQPLLPKSPINAYAAPHRAVRDPVSNATVVNVFGVPAGAVDRDTRQQFLRFVLSPGRVVASLSPEELRALDLWMQRIKASWTEVDNEIRAHRDDRPREDGGRFTAEHEWPRRACVGLPAFPTRTAQLS